MPIVGGLDIHRKQITFGYLDTALSEARKILRQACHILTELGDGALTTI